MGEADARSCPWLMSTGARAAAGAPLAKGRARAAAGGGAAGGGGGGRRAGALALLLFHGAQEEAGAAGGARRAQGLQREPQRARLRVQAAGGRAAGAACRAAVLQGDALRCACSSCATCVTWRWPQAHHAPGNSRRKLTPCSCRGACADWNVQTCRQAPAVAVFLLLDSCVRSISA